MFPLTEASGRRVLVQVTSAGGRRPLVVLSVPAPQDVAGRLARAGFAVVWFEPSPDALAAVLDAVERSALGVEADSYALVEPGPGDSLTVARGVGGGGGRSSGVVVPGVEELVQWLVTHHV